MRYLDFSEILSSIKWLWSHNEIEKFENEFAGYIGCKYALGTSYGRTAIYLGLKAIDSCQKEVLTPALTCSVVRDAILLAGAVPVFVDVEAASLNMILSDARKKLTQKTTAIILIHYYGGVCSNTNEIIKFAKENNLTVIEDCAHSLGAEYNGVRIGNSGDIAAFSLTKNILNFGGGLLCTNNENFYEKARAILRENDRKSRLQKLKELYTKLNHGYKTTIDKVIFDRIGRSIFKWWLINVLDIFFGAILKPAKLLKGITKRDANIDRSKFDVQPLASLTMHPMIAAAGRIQLKKIDFLNERRIKIAQKLRRKLPDYYRDFPIDRLGNKNVYTCFPMWFKGYNLDKLVIKCKAKGLLLRRSWPAFQQWWEEQDTKDVRTICDNLLLLEINPMLTDKEIDKAVEIIEKALAE